MADDKRNGGPRRRGFRPTNMGYTPKEDPNRPILRDADGYPVPPKTKSGVWRPSDEPAKKKD